MEFSRYGINGGQNVANIDASMPWSLSKMTVSHIVVLADYDEQRLDARSKGLHMEPIAQYEAKRLHLDYPALFPITTQHKSTKYDTITQIACTVVGMQQN